MSCIQLLNEVKEKAGTKKLWEKIQSLDKMEQEMLYFLEQMEYEVIENECFREENFSSDYYSIKVMI